MPKSDRVRFSAKRKREAVLRLLRGEDLDIVSREMGVTGATLATWRESFLTNGAVSIDNNAAERGLRRITIGRELWLFFREQAKLEHVDRLMSITYTARLQGVDEFAYLVWVLEQLARREWSPQAARKLLPDAWLAWNEQQVEKSSTDGG